MPAAVEMLRMNRFKLLVLLGVILFSIGMYTYTAVAQTDTEDGQLQHVPLEDYTWDDAGRIKVANKTSGNSTLVFATVIFRHGDRNPTNNAYKTDPYADGAAYIGGWGALTLKGKRRMYLLGQHIRSRYSALLPPLYLPEHLYVLSSDADRCIMSAECFLTALYPPLPFQKIHPELNWQPIPVHTVPRALDRVVSAKSDCPKFTEALKCVYKDSESVEINTNSTDLLRLLTEKTGQPVMNYAQAETLYNTVALQKELGLKMPEWVTDKVLAKMKQLAITSLAAFTKTPFMRKIKGGPLLDEIRLKMENKASPANKLKLFVVSGHDLTLINLLRTLGFTDTPWKPDFSAALLVELHKINQQHVVQIWFDNGYNEKSEFKLLKLAKCDSSCPLASFLEATQDMVPSMWQQDCTMEPSDPVVCSKL